MSGIKWVFSMMHYCVNIDWCALSGGVVSYLGIDWPAAPPACWEQHRRLQLKPLPRKQESRPRLGRTDDIITAEGNSKSAVCVTFSKIHWMSNPAFYSASHSLFCLAGVDSPGLLPTCKSTSCWPPLWCVKNKSSDWLIATHNNETYKEISSSRHVCVLTRKQTFFAPLDFWFEHTHIWRTARINQSV